MCDVCVAERALWAGRCKDDKCMAYAEGEQIKWSDAPMPVKNPKWAKDRLPKWAKDLAMDLRKRKGLPPAVRKKIAKKMKNRIDPGDLGAPAVCVRAVGKNAENKPAKYQIRLSCQPWPRNWTPTDDLAGSMGDYGLDVKWEHVPRLVQDWVLGKRAHAPTEKELEGARPKQKGPVSATMVIPSDMLKEMKPKALLDMIQSAVKEGTTVSIQPPKVARKGFRVLPGAKERRKVVNR